MKRLIVATLMLTLLACQAETPTAAVPLLVSRPGEGLPVPNEIMTTDITAGEDAFSPSTTIIRQGTTVRWIQTREKGQTIISGTFQSPFLRQGESWIHTFHEPGIYFYSSRGRPFMHGRIVVEKS